MSAPVAVVIPRNARDTADRELLDQYDCADMVAAPLVGEQGMAGAVLLRDRLGDVGTFDVADGRPPSVLGRYTSIVLENGRLVDALQSEAARREHQALHDQLTDLPNRRYLIERGPELLSTTDAGTQSAMLLVDLDGLKEINDTFGHASGDAVLVEVAGRLRQVVDDEVTLVRLGGDEFALLVPGIVAADDAVEYASTHSRLAQPSTCGQPGHRAARPERGHRLVPGARRRRIDAAAVRRRGHVAGPRPTHRERCIHRADQDSHTPERLALVADLRAALAEGSLVLGYQPIKALDSNRIAHVEVLFEVGAPDAWVPSSALSTSKSPRQSDLIRQLTSYVLHHVFFEQRR